MGYIIRLTMTSLEFLISKLQWTYSDIDAFKQYVLQAEEMHKKEIIDAYNEGFKISGEGWNGEYGIKDFKNLSKEIKSEDLKNNFLFKLRINS